MTIIPLPLVYQHCLDSSLTCEAAAALRGKAGGALRVTTAYARALLVIRMLLGSTTWRDGYERSLDDCFEMNDGTEVVIHLVTIAEADARIMELLLTHSATRGCYDGWKVKADECRALELPLGV